MIFTVEIDFKILVKGNAEKMIFIKYYRSEPSIVPQIFEFEKIRELRVGIMIGFI